MSGPGNTLDSPGKNVTVGARSFLMGAEGIFFQGVAVPRRHPLGRRPRPLPRRSAAASEDHGRFFAGLARWGGVDLDRYRATALYRRLPACLRFLRLRTPDEALAAMERKPELARALLNVVLLGVTEFFRDMPVFERLRAEVLPVLRARRQRLRVWSAACSAGQELYSLGMLLADADMLAGVELLGTDCRAAALAEAEAGRFARAAVEPLPGAWRRHFVDEGSTVQMVEGLRTAIRWKEADLLVAVEPGPWDLILWRNMAIYLEPAVADRVWLRLVAELAPGGFLVTGKADHPGTMLPLRRLAPCIYQKIEQS